MRDLRQLRPWVLLAGITLTYRLVVQIVWAFLPAYNPVTTWLLDSYGGSNSTLYYALIHLHDSIVNVAVALPFAYLITKLQPDRRWLYALAAVVAMFLWDYRLVLFVRQDFFDFMIRYDRAFIGLVLYLSYLPVTMLCLSVVQSRRNAA